MHSSGSSAAGHQLGAVSPEAWKVATGCVAELVTLPVVASSVVWAGASAWVVELGGPPVPKVPGLVGYFQYDSVPPPAGS